MNPNQETQPQDIQAQTAPQQPAANQADQAMVAAPPPVVRLNPMFPMHVASIPDVDLGSKLSPNIRDFMDKKAASAGKSMAIDVSMDLAGKGMTTSEVAQMRLEATVMRNMTRAMNQINTDGGYVDIADDDVLAQSAKAARSITDAAGVAGESGLKKVLQDVENLSKQVDGLQTAWLATANKPPENKWRQDDLIAMGVAMLLMPGGAGEIYKWFEERKNRRYESQMQTWQSAVSAQSNELQFANQRLERTERKYELMKREIEASDDEDLKMALSGIQAAAEAGNEAEVGLQIKAFNERRQAAGKTAISGELASGILEKARSSKEKIEQDKLEFETMSMDRAVGKLNASYSSFQRSKTSAEAKATAAKHNGMVRAANQRFGTQLMPEISDAEIAEIAAGIDQANFTKTIGSLASAAQRIAAFTKMPHESLFRLLTKWSDDPAIASIMGNANASLEDQLKAGQLVKQKRETELLGVKTALAKVDLKWADRTKKAMLAFIVAGTDQRNASASFLSTKTEMLPQEMQISMMRLITNAFTAYRIANNNMNDQKVKEWMLENGPKMKAIENGVDAQYAVIEDMNQKLAANPNDETLKAKKKAAEDQLKAYQQDHDKIMGSFKSIGDKYESASLDPANLMEALKSLSESNGGISDIEDAVIAALSGKTLPAGETGGGGQEAGTFNNNSPRGTSLDGQIGGGATIGAKAGNGSSKPVQVDFGQQKEPDKDAYMKAVKNWESYIGSQEKRLIEAKRKAAELERERVRQPNKDGRKRVEDEIAKLKEMIGKLGSDIASKKAKKPKQEDYVKVKGGVSAATAEPGKVYKTPGGGEYEVDK